MILIFATTAGDDQPRNTVPIFFFDFLPGFCVQEYDSSGLQKISGMPVCAMDVLSVSQPDPNLCVHSFGSRKKGSIKLTMSVKYLFLKHGCNNEKETTVGD